MTKPEKFDAIARAICCPAGCMLDGDNTEYRGSCYCDTSDFRGSGIEKKTKAVLAALSSSSDDVHYLKSIRLRLEKLYDDNQDDPRLREHISDKCDWMDEKIVAAQSSPEDAVTASQDGDDNGRGR